MDEDELRKRTTDCLFFLASPLTCKKGMECEYRHSEIARLNPRECWYWMEGSCFNPNCAFRHPPLKGLTGSEVESSDPNFGLRPPVNKKDVPCYYFFETYYCKKGDRCPFLHGADFSAHEWKPSKAVSGATSVVAPVKKTSMGSNVEATPMKARPNTTETIHKGAVDPQHKPMKDFYQLTCNNVSSECEQAPAVRLDSLAPAEGYIKSLSRAVTDQSLDEHVNGFVEQEDLLDLSPGFDVLVEDESERRVYEHDLDFVTVIDGKGRELDAEFMRYDYEYDENHIVYDPEHPEPEIKYEQKICDSYDFLDDGQGCDYIRNVSSPRERVLNQTSPRKRKFIQMEPLLKRWRGVDLRDLLMKRRMIDGHDGSIFSRRIVGSRERPGVNQRGRFRRVPINRQYFKEKRHGKQQFNSSVVFRKSAPREKRTAKETTVFTGPKSLDQIRKEKKKARETGDMMPGTTVHSCRAASESFQGPKSLNEILKDKRRLGSVVCSGDN